MPNMQKIIFQEQQRKELEDKIQNAFGQTRDEREVGDGTPWKTRGKCSRGESCSSEHDGNKTGAGKEKIPFSVRDQKQLENVRT